MTHNVLQHDVYSRSWTKCFQSACNPVLLVLAQLVGVDRPDALAALFAHEEFVLPVYNLAVLAARFGTLNRVAADKHMDIAMARLSYQDINQQSKPTIPQYEKIEINIPVVTMV